MGCDAPAVGSWCEHQVTQKHGEMIEHNFDSSVLFPQKEFVTAVAEQVSAFKRFFLEQ